VILISSILLAACIITTVVLWVVEGRSSMMSTGAIIISIGSIIASILSVVFIYRSRIRRRSDEKKLNESFFRDFELIKDSIMNSPLPKSYQKSIVEDVLELFLTAQANGKTAETAIGDAESFAKDIIRACMSKSRSIVIDFLNGAIAFILFTLFITTLMWFENLSIGFFNQRIDTIMVLFVAVISFILIPAIRQLAYKKNAWVYFIPLAVGITFIGIIELLRAYFYSGIVQALLDGSVSMIPNGASLAVLLAVILILFTLKASIQRLPELK